MKNNIKTLRLISLFSIGFLVMAQLIFAQQMNGGQRQNMREKMLNMQHGGLQHLNHQNMQMNIHQMMKNMKDMVLHTDEMIKSIENSKQPANQKASDEVHNEMLDMGKNLNQMTKNMQQLLFGISMIMTNEEIMQKTTQKNSMKEMRQNMGKLMRSMDKLIQNFNDLNINNLSKD